MKDRVTAKNNLINGCSAEFGVMVTGFAELVEVTSSWIGFALAVLIPSRIVAVVVLVVLEIFPEVNPVLSMV